MLNSIGRNAVMLPEDFQAIATVEKKDCLMLQTMHYEISSPQDANGYIYSNTRGSILDMSVVVDDYHNVHVFYDRLQNNNYLPFSFIFNPLFDNDGLLNTYGEATVVEGFVVDVQEKFDHYDVNDKQMMVVAKILLSSVRYVAGNNSTITEIISK